MNRVGLTLRALCLAAAMALSASAAIAAGYKVTPISRAGADNLWFWGINNAGLITGYAANSDYSTQTGFIYNSKTRTYTDLTGPAGAVGNYATGISDVGTVVGGYTTAAQESRAFIYEGGSYTDFSLPGATTTTLRGISDDARYLTGVYSAGAGDHGFIFDRSTSTITDVGRNTIVQGMNGRSWAAGSTSGSERAPFLYFLETVARVDYLPATDRYRDVNDSGIVAGYGIRDGFENFVALVGGPENLSALNVEGSVGTFGYGINNAGTVVGLYDLGDGRTHAFIAASVPEPGTWALLFFGLVGLATMGRRARV